MSRRLVPFIAAVLVAANAAPQPPDGTVVRQIEVVGIRRTYRLHLPRGIATPSPLPLVLVFHGGGSTAVAMERLTRFSPLADRERFIVVYPQGLANHWNDGRDPAVMGARADADDVRFVAAIIEDIARQHAIDRRSVYATGFSNGGIFSHYLAARLSDRIAAIAPVAGGIPERFKPDFRPDHAVSVLILQGTDDPIVPIGGGELRGGRGRLVPTQQAVDLWLLANACGGPAKPVQLADRDPADGCRVTSRVWSGGREGTEVIYDELKGGGHTWPGGRQYLPASVVGRTCRDIDATVVIWRFFEKHRKPRRRPGGVGRPPRTR